MLCNLRLINKFFDAFNWWRKDPKNRSCWTNGGGGWTLNEMPFNKNLGDHILIVINDGFAEQRKAEADGHDLEYITKGDECFTRLKDEADGYKTVQDLVDRYYSDSEFQIRVRPSVPEWTKHCSTEKPVICRVGTLFPKSYDQFAGIVGTKCDPIFGYVPTDDGTWLVCEPITIDDLHDFQRKGWFKGRHLTALVCSFFEGGNEEDGERLINFLRKQGVK
jgi:hypothetical protein